MIRRYLSNKIILEIFSKKEINYFQIDFTLGKVKEIFVLPSDRDLSKIRINSFVINDVCHKSHWNSIGVSKRLEVWTNTNNRRYLVFNYLCNTIESGGIIPLRNFLNYRFLSIWISRYREILDWFIYAAKLIINKAPRFF